MTTTAMCADCGTKPAHARNLCNTCYARHRAHGTPARVRHVGRRPCDFPEEAQP